MTNKDAFFNDKSLKNRIIYSDTLNETEFLRTLAKQGINTLGLRIMNSYDLSLFILSKLGISEKRRYLNNKEQDFVYYSLSASKAFNDASNIRVSINSFRDTGRGNTPHELDQYLNKDYPEKRSAVVNAFDCYNTFKKNNNCYDLFDLLYYLKNNPQKLDLDLCYFEDLPFSELAVSVFKQFFNTTTMLFASLPFESKAKNGFKCFGKNNEIANVVNKINENKLKLDQCLVVLVDSNDITDLTTSLNKYSIPYTSSLGMPFIQTNVGRLVALLKKMDSMDWGINAYQELFNAPYFNKDKYTGSLTSDYDYKDFIKYTGWLRPSFDRDLFTIDESLYQYDCFNYKVVCQAVQSLCNEINNNTSVYEFVRNNVIDDGNTFEALQLLEKYDLYCREYNVAFDNVVDALLNDSISRHISRSGAVHICSLDQAFSSLRDNVFVVGLDSGFPGNPEENYLIFDDEYEKMGASQYTSEKIVKKKEALMNLLINCSKNSYLSYSYCNIIDTKASNPSSVLMNVQMTEFTYEDDKLLSNNSAITNSNNGQLSDPDNTHLPYTYKYADLLNKTYSPSKIVDYFDLEQRLKFFLEVLFDIQEDDDDDPYSVISPIDKGNLLHRLAVGFEKKNYKSVDEFVNKGLIEFDNFLKMKPPITKEAGDNEKEAFKKALTNFFNGDPQNKHLYSEKQLNIQDIEGIKFKGRFDRLEEDVNGNIILVDYKTRSSKPTHEKDDPVSCLQGLIYAEMIGKQLGLKVQRCEFRYPFISKDTKIPIICDSANMKEMHNLIKEFKDAIENGDFDIPFTKKSQKHKYIDKYEHLISLVKELKH